MKTLGEKIKFIRHEKRLTQEGLGELLWLTKQAVANVESGHNNPSIIFLAKLVEILNVNGNWLLAGQGTPFNPAQFEDVKDEILKEVEEMLKRRGIT